MMAPRWFRNLKVWIGNLSDDLRDVTILIAFAASIIVIYWAVMGK